MQLTEKTKKILMIIGFVAVVIIIALALWVVFFRKPPEKPALEDTVAAELPQSGSLPGRAMIDAEERSSIRQLAPLPISPIAIGGITETEVLNLSGTIAPTISGDGKSTTFLNSNDGRFYKITPSGQSVQLSDKQFFGVEHVKWAPDKNKTIMEFPDGSNVLFDFQKQEQVTLPKHWNQFDFSPQGDEIASLSLGRGPENRWLVTANPDGSGARALEPLGENADKVTVSYSPNSQTVAFSQTGEPPGGERQSILLIGKNKENLPALVVDGGGFQPNWAPDGKKLLYSTYHSNDDWNPRLWVVNGQGDSIGTGKKDIGLKTWAEKCNFADENTLYCAVPDKLDQGMGLVPDLAKFTADSIYKIDVRTGAKSIVGKPAGNFSVDNLSVDENQSVLYFNDSATGALHKMRLR